MRNKTSLKALAALQTLPTISSLLRFERINLKIWLHTVSNNMGFLKHEVKSRDILHKSTSTQALGPRSFPAWPQNLFPPHAFHHYDVIPPSLSDFLPWKDEAPPLRMWPNRAQTYLDSVISGLWDPDSACLSSLVSLRSICDARDERGALLMHFRALFLPNQARILGSKRSSCRMSSPLLIWWTFAPDATADLARSPLCLPSPCFLLLFLCHIKVASAIPNGPRRPLGAFLGRRLLISPFQALTPFSAVFRRKERNLVRFLLGSFAQI